MNKVRQNMSKIGLGLMAAMGATSLAPAQAAASNATVTVIHGIPGQDIGAAADLPVDIQVGTICALTNFKFGNISSRIPLPAGSYDIRVRLSDGACGGATAVQANGVPFAAGENATVIAHLSASGAPTASKFVNDLTPSRNNEGRVTAHHTAAAPAVDLDFRQRRSNVAKFKSVVNGQSGSFDDDAIRTRLSIAPAGGRPIFRDRFTILEGKTIFAYAVGTVGTPSFGLIIDVQDQAFPAKVTVIHGINGTDIGQSASHLPVDIEVVGVGCVLTNFTFESISEQLQLPAGEYDINVRLSNGSCGGAVAVAATDVPFAAGEDATVIAHVSANNVPTASKFTNDLSQSRRRDGRFVVHHTAAAPAVDIALSTMFGRRVIDLQGVTNGQSGGGDVRRGLYIFSVAPAGGQPLVRKFAPIHGRTLVLVYAVGNLNNGTLDFIVDDRHL